MKLRIQENSVRLRLTRSEVARLHNSGMVECGVGFPGDRTFSYSVRSASDAAVVSASFDGDSIRIVLPLEMANTWAEGSEVTIEGPGSGVHILVEKDFQCLHRDAEQDPEAYPNPLA